MNKKDKQSSNMQFYLYIDKLLNTNTANLLNIRNYMLENTLYKSEVDILLEQQRDQSDARSIINEIERLNSFEGEHRYRWIWELLQNAKDEAGNGIDIVCELDEHNFRFKHNGQPFLSEHLLALTRRTSTKPIDGSNGNTGKFGTGFVTSHLLNKKVKIKGIHVNSNGRRSFELNLDRSPELLDEMMKCIACSIQAIREINAMPAISDLAEEWNIFEYQLGETGKEVAEGGIRQLEKNLAFAMLVNKSIRSIKILQSGFIREYITSIDGSSLKGLSFIRLVSKHSKDDAKGLLYSESDELTMAVPAEKLTSGYSLLPIGGRTRLFKELPLIGTEEPFLPVIVQHANFHPTEPRDGVRTKIASDQTELDDPKAKSNRDAFRTIVAEFPNFIAALREGNVLNLHLLAENSLPLNVEAYYDRGWYEREVLEPIRSIIVEHPLVKTVSGLQISIREALFPQPGEEPLDLLYSLISRFYPSKCPDIHSYEDWARVINQESQFWPQGITLDAKQLIVNTVNQDALNSRFLGVAERNNWLQELITYLECSEQERLGLEHLIYPTQGSKLKRQNEVFHDTGLDPQFKKISIGVGRVLEDELLPPGFKAKFVADFNIKESLIQLNNTIGSLKPEAATPQQVQAIIDVCCTFKAAKAERRDQWFDLLHRLLPEQAQNKIYINLNEDFSWDPAEKWVLKYVCNLVQKASTIEHLTQLYFHHNEKLAFNWLNDLLTFIFRNEENKDAGLKYQVVLTQDGRFKLYSDYIFLENNPSEAADKAKTLYREYTGKGDPKAFLVHGQIKNDFIRSADLDMLTRPIDDLFNAREAEDLVKEGQKYHQLFLNLKDWLEAYPNGEDYFPIFSKKKPILYIKAFGEGSSLGRLLKLKKSVEEIEQLDKLSLSPNQMKLLDDAVAQIGNANSLIEKAQEMAQFAEEVRWRQAVGRAAENAFVQALSKANPQFSKPENPDDGKDFIIRIGEKEYAIELKSAIEKKETVKMSLKQGETAVAEKDSYALCVISRPSGELTNVDQFIDKARFVIDIGEKIGDKISNWKDGLSGLDKNEDVSVQLDSKTGSINIKKAIWEDEMKFPGFIEHLERFFKLSVEETVVAAPSSN